MRRRTRRRRRRRTSERRRRKRSERRNCYEMSYWTSSKRSYHIPSLAPNCATSHKL